MLVHDWLTGMRGGEKVLEVLCEAYPDSRPVHAVPRARQRLAGHRTAAPAHVLASAPPGLAALLPLLPAAFPAAIEQFDLDRYDLVISTSHCAAKAVVEDRPRRHLCYCFTPMRYAWDQFDAYFGEGRVGTAEEPRLRPVLSALARWDAATAGRVDRYVAISQHVASRIRRYYNRDAVVIYPPVDTGFYSPR